MQDIEPLEPAMWFGAIAKLEQRRIRSAEIEFDRLLRHAYHLLQLTPRPLRSIIRSELSETQYDVLLGARALESAAMGLIGQPMRYGLVRLIAGHFEAKVWLTDSAEPTSVHSTFVASALLGAWAQTIVAMDTRSADLQVSNPHPALHKARYVRRPRQFEH